MCGVGHVIEMVGKLVYKLPALVSLITISALFNQLVTET